jgi:DUF4097 and DUF4098 domain-containing protein YvlB
VQINKMLSSLLTGGALVVCFAGTVQAQRNYGETLDTTVTLRQGTVDLSLMSGRIEVVGGSGSEAHIRATTSLGDIQFDAGPGRIRLSVEPGSRGGVGDAQFELTVPAGTRVIANSLSGSVSIRGVKGEVDVNTVSGSIDVSDAARKVKLESVSGNVEAAHIAGDTRASSVSGRVEVDDVAGDLETESVSGRITMLGARSKYVRAGSVSGRIAYAGTFEGGGSYEFKSHSGSVRLSLPANVGAEVRVETFSGSIDSDFPVTLQPTTTSRGHSSGRIEFKIGDGRSRIVAESFSGTIKIERGDGRDSRD